MDEAFHPLAGLPASPIIDDYEIKFVFRRLSPDLRLRLREFWTIHRDAWFSRNGKPTRYSTQAQTKHTNQGLTLKNVACVAFERSTHEIVGFAWVSFQKMPTADGRFHYSYFQKLFVLQGHRSFSLSSNLLKHFLRGMSQCSTRSPLARTIVAINSNKRLLSRPLSKYFSRLGFGFVGVNPAGNDIWEIDL